MSAGRSDTSNSDDDIGMEESQPLPSNSTQYVQKVNVVMLNWSLIQQMKFLFTNNLRLARNTLGQENSSFQR